VFLIFCFAKNKKESDPGQPNESRRGKFFLFLFWVAKIKRNEILVQQCIAPLHLLFFIFRVPKINLSACAPFLFIFGVANGKL